MKNFTISLYLFQLARAFHDPIDQANEAQAQLLGNNFTTQLSKQITLEPTLETQLLHDTYFVDLTFFSQDQTIDFLPEDISQYNPLLPDQIHSLLDEKDCSIDQTIIGQTIIIYGVISESAANPDSANNYVRAFLKDTAYENDNIISSKQKHLFGIPLFEYFCPLKSCPIKKPANFQESDCHILVLLNHQGENSLAQLSKHYQNLADLLCSYHKVKYVYYQQAKDSYQDAVKVAQSIDQEITNFRDYVADKTKNLDKLSNLLDKLPLLALQHAKYCGELEAHQTTIDINQQKYQDSLQKLLNAGSSLDSWQEFSNQTKNVFLKQIQYWLNYMNPRKELGQQLTASIRGIVEIEQAKSDRSLERKIEILGAGLGAGGIAASAISGHVDKPPITPQGNTQIYPAVTSIGLSLLAALLFGGCVGWINGTIPRFLKARNLSQISQNEERRKVIDPIDK